VADRCYTRRRCRWRSRPSYRPVHTIGIASRCANGWPRRPKSLSASADMLPCAVAGHGCRVLRGELNVEIHIWRSAPYSFSLLAKLLFSLTKMTLKLIV
jgi:hypothetical protein